MEKPSWWGHHFPFFISGACLVGLCGGWGSLALVFPSANEFFMIADFFSVLGIVPGAPVAFTIASEYREKNKKWRKYAEIEAQRPLFENLARKIDELE